MKPLLFDLASAPGLGQSLAHGLSSELGELDRRQFPDGETYLGFATETKGRDVILLCTLDHPDPKVAPLLFAAAAAREQGARTVGLVAPYLAYMRQDRQFRPGEAVTSKFFARLVSGHFDWLVTIDPHLHRYSGLDAIYSVPAIAATATSAIAAWVRENVEAPILIGPDEESRQWVERIASLAGGRSTILEKHRSGDYSVSIVGEGLKHLGSGTPVLVDDIASSARTLIEAVRLVGQYGREPPVCAVVHPIFAGRAYEDLLSAGAERIVSSNTIAHPSSVIDISSVLAEGVRAVSGLQPD